MAGNRTAWLTTSDPGRPEWSLPARYLGLGFLTVAIAGAIGLFAPVYRTALLGFLFALLCDIPARWLLRTTRLAYRRAVLVVFLALLVGLLGILLALLPWLADSLSGLLSALRGLRTTSAHGLLALIMAPLLTITRNLLSVLLALISDLVGLITVVVLALFLAFVLLLDLDAARGSLAAWVPPRFAREVTLLLINLDQIWSAFLGAQIAYAVVLGTFSVVQYWIMGVPFPLLMGVINGLLSLIPSIGGLVGSLAVAVPCLLLGSSTWPAMPNWQFALLVLLINVPITQGSYYLFALPLLGKSVRLPLYIVTLGVLLGLALNSIVLAFLTVPIVSTVRIIGGYVLAKVAQREPFPGQTVPEPLEPGFFSQLGVPRPPPPVSGAGQPAEAG